MNEQIAAALGLEIQHSDLRLSPAEPDESRDMNNPLNHIDLRIVKAESDQEAGKE